MKRAYEKTKFNETPMFSQTSGQRVISMGKIAILTDRRNAQGKVFAHFSKNNDDVGAVMTTAEALTARSVTAHVDAAARIVNRHSYGSVTSRM